MLGEEVEEEPAFQYIPESPRVPNGGVESDPLVESIMLLQEGLESGTALTLFEVTTLAGFRRGRTHHTTIPPSSP